MDRKLKVGLIGANVSYGWSPKAHIPALIGLPEIELAAICTQHKQSAEISSKTFNIPLAFDDYRQMIEREDLDMIGVSVRVPKHHAITMDVLEAGKHVYTEWPLGANLKEAIEMANNFVAPEKHTYRLPGQTSILALKFAINNMRSNGQISDHDKYIGEKIAFVLSGGITDTTKELTEENILNLEKNAIYELMQNDLTLERLEHILETGKYLRN